jgi:hypothetical protein
MCSCVADWDGMQCGVMECSYYSRVKPMSLSYSHL